MFNSNVFDYINVLNKAADASWLRDQAISNNIANINTPGYKRQDVSFEAELERALKHSRYRSVDEKVGNLDLNQIRLQGRPYRDAENFSYRLDKNNVDVDTENAEMAKNQIQYNAVVDSISKEFSMLKSVMK